ncbi:DUF7793 family protein [Aestuariirhabdus haliotis]|nr:hypothetical protein [Aestuariirhabdus haliotis]MCL6418491.1 hypothetical protein [Aestuariirhabdus haliotis]
MEEDGIMRVDYGPDAHVTLESVQHIARLAYDICSDKHPALITAQRTVKVDNEALKYLQGEEYRRISAAVAVVTKTPLERFLLRMYATLQPPTFPVKGFSSEAEALAWLESYRSPKG